MWWSKKQKIESQESIELSKRVFELKHRLDALELDLAMYVKKLKASRGLGKKEDEESKDINTDNVLVPV